VVQGRTADAGEKIVRDAKALEEAGVFGIFLEMVTEEAAKLVTENVSVPTIGIGSGRYCDGQVLVLHDILGLYPKFVPKFAKRYADLATNVKDALRVTPTRSVPEYFPTLNTSSKWMTTN